MHYHKDIHYYFSYTDFVKNPQKKSYIHVIDMDEFPSFVTFFYSMSEKKNLKVF